jgi:hypothetical protein
VIAPQPLAKLARLLLTPLADGNVSPPKSFLSLLLHGVILRFCGVFEASGGLTAFICRAVMKFRNSGVILVALLRLYEEP